MSIQSGIQQEAARYFEQQSLFEERWFVKLPDQKSRPIRTLDQLYRHMLECHKCPLADTRTNLVFGVGNPHADVVFIGEAPGRQEDLQGEPFVGRAGQLLNKILESIDVDRDSVYITNILKCRPPENRDPTVQETALCIPYLEQQLRMIKPKVIVAVGRIAAQYLLNTSAPISQLRGRIYQRGASKLIVTFHPAALLRNPNLKRDTWQDMKMLRKILDEKENSA
jgi:uracil-DNA glycosylase family 4